ncbi:hypothetical protein [Dactylosporangium vinaceum]
MLMIGAVSSASEQDVAALRLFGAVGTIVAVAASMQSWGGRRAHQRFGIAHAAAASAWHRAMFCTQCGVSWVPGDRRTVSLDRVLVQVLLSQAKAVQGRGWQ